jgi:hypothetical protein
MTDNRKYQLPPELPPEDPQMTVEALKHVVQELTHKIHFLVAWADEKGLLEDHAFTFPDGDIWKAKDVDPLLDKS